MNQVYESTVKYQSIDGEVFDDQASCESHERFLVSNLSDEMTLGHFFNEIKEKDLDHYNKLLYIAFGDSNE